jgi:hypothetical protein
MEPDLKSIEPTVTGLEEYLNGLPPQSQATENGFVADYVKSTHHLDEVLTESGRFGWIYVSRLWRDGKGFIHEVEEYVQLPRELGMFRAIEDENPQWTAEQALSVIAKINEE